MGPVVVLTFAFIGVTLLAKRISEYFEFMFKSNLKYKILDYLGKMQITIETRLVFVYLAIVTNHWNMCHIVNR